jgi:hypothetical protein
LDITGTDLGTIDQLRKELNHGLIIFDGVAAPLLVGG